MPKSTILATVKDAMAVPYFIPPAPKKRTAIEISKGKRPLHGMKLFVRMAISRLPGRVDDPGCHSPRCVAAKAHGHGQCLLSMGAAPLKNIIQVKEATLGR